ncbi:MAG: DUF1573 domain-containing protein [Botrimarina sp.]
MKLFSLLLVSVVLGGVLGVALARNDVGRVDERFYPSPEMAAAAAGAALPSAPGGPAASVQGPVAEVDDPVYDFGAMQRGTTESHEFIVTNAGTKPLTLQVGQTTCKCTLGEVSSRPLAPGESTPVRLEWVAKSMPGAFQQHATVITNDPLRSRLELTVTGRITEPAGLQPNELLFGQMAADEERAASVYLASFEPDAPPLRATARLEDNSPLEGKVELRVEQVPADELPQEKAKSGVKITATAGPGLPIGHVTGWVKVRTNLPEGPRPSAGEQSVSKSAAAGADAQGEADELDGLELQVPLYARVEGDISLRGVRWSRELGILNLGKVRRSNGTSETLLVSFKGEHAEGARARLESVDPEWLQVELGEPQEVRDGVTHQKMTVTIPPGRTPVIRSGGGQDEGGIGAGDAVISLSTNHPVTSELDVRVRFVIAE